MPGATEPWAQGAATYWIDRAEGDRIFTVAVRCRFGSLASEDLALLDTGAQWSVVGGELADILEDDFHEPGPTLGMKTRFGTYQGRLHRLSIQLVADSGSSLDVDATALVLPSWPGPPVLGYRGFMERMRLALDPGVHSTDQWLYFGLPREEPAPSPIMIEAQ